MLALLGLQACSAGPRFQPPPVVVHGGDRDEWQQPDRVVAALAIRPGATIADIGSGAGYFTLRLAQATGPSGRVYAIDLDRSDLQLLVDEAARRGLSNVSGIVGTTGEPRLKPSSIDLVFTANTYHHIDGTVAYFRSLRRALKPGGKLVIIDLDRRSFGRKNTPHAIARDRILGEMNTAGYRLAAEHRFLEKQSFLVFESTETARTRRPRRVSR
ncbi:MAG: arsenite methyltransferase [Hyphomicrobiaceae bacterium]